MLSVLATCPCNFLVERDRLKKSERSRPPPKTYIPSLISARRQRDMAPPKARRVRVKFTQEETPIMDEAPATVTIRKDYVVVSMCLWITIVIIIIIAGVAEVIGVSYHNASHYVLGHLVKLPVDMISATAYGMWMALVVTWHAIADVYVWAHDSAFNHTV